MHKTAGPDLPSEIAHSQSHGLTVEKCRGEVGGWRTGFVKWNKGQQLPTKQAHDLYTVGERKRAVVLKLLCTSLSKIWAETLN